MNATTYNLMDVDEPGSTALPVLRRRRFTATWSLVAAVILLFWTAGSCPAMDQPPQEPDQQRAWLVGHLASDMEALGTFDGTAFAKVPGIVDRLTDDQVGLLAQYYFLTRAKTLPDSSLYGMQQQGYSDNQVNEAKAPIADLLTVMNDEIVACYDQIVTMPQPALNLANICYASVPGWCCNVGCYVPEWYYDNGCYVGPCFDAAYAGAWAVPVCRAYYDHGSRFYTTYHAIPNAVYARRSTNLAHRQADWFRHQGDWRSVVAHDRLVHRSPTAYRSPSPRVATGANRHVGVPGSAYDHRSAPQRAGSTQRQPQVAQHQNPKPHGKHASAPHFHAAYSSPKPQAHAAHARPQPQHAAQVHSNSGHKGHG